MSKYKKHFIESWEELDGSFIPHTRQDIINNISRLCLQKIGNQEVKATSTENFDLILSRHKQEQNFSHCLIANFPLIDFETKQNWLNNARGNISILVTQSDPTVRRVYAIFDNTNSISLEEIEDMKNFGRNQKHNVDVIFGFPPN